MNGVVQLLKVKKTVLLLISQHLESRFAENCEIQRRTLRCGIGKDKLMSQCCLSTSWCARDNVERELRNTAAQNLIQSGHPRWQFIDSDAFVLFHFPFSPSEFISAPDRFGHISLNNRSVRGSPMKVSSNPTRWAMSTAPAASSPFRPSSDPSSLTCTPSSAWTKTPSSACKVGFSKTTIRKWRHQVLP